ncbi:MAG: 1-deoxy-D-xylulose-5-phosphate synthase [bacterium]|nr:1-deoxy-D-xylulose-5-phosphate synthase [bacterium]
MNTTNFDNTKYLKYINYKNIKDFNYNQLEILAQELRDFITEVVYHNGGHYGSNLGVVELTISLLRNFDPEQDKIVFDTSHQSYIYKILTDRKEKFHTLRTFKGISGFSKIKESKLDHYGAGHAGTGLSAALGYAKARDILKQDYNVVAVIGDAALTCGVTFEAINNIGQYPSKLIIVLNDNEFSISPNVGAFSIYLKKLRNNPFLVKVEKKVDEVLNLLPINSLIKNFIIDTKNWIEEGFTKVVSPSIVGVIFEEFGIQYIGPVDGHNIKLLDEVLLFAKKLEKPVIIHVLTEKGKGSKEAQEHQEKLHGVAKGKLKISNFIYFSTDEGLKVEKKEDKKLKTYTEVFGETIIELAKNDDKIVAITAAMPSGTGLINFSKLFPDRFFDVGIAEEHAVIFSTTLALKGLKPVVCIYSTFLQRAFDMLIHDVALQNIPVLFVLDRAGIVGEDGPTHHGVFDLSYLRMIPNFQIFVPSNELELKNILYTVLQNLDKPTAIRYPRDNIEGLNNDSKFSIIDLYSWILKYESSLSNYNKKVAILATGRLNRFIPKVISLLEKSNIYSKWYNCISIKPLDNKVLSNLVDYDLILTLEDNVLAGGFGSAVLEYFNDNFYNKKLNLLRIGWGDYFVEHGAIKELYDFYGINEQEIFNKILEKVDLDVIKIGVSNNESV